MCGPVPLLVISGWDLAPLDFLHQLVQWMTPGNGGVCFDFKLIPVGEITRLKVLIKYSCTLCGYISMYDHHITVVHLSVVYLVQMIDVDLCPDEAISSLRNMLADRHE